MEDLCNQAGIGRVIREKTAELGGIASSLAFVHSHLLSTIEGSDPGLSLPDVFPPYAQQRLAGKLCRCRGMIQEVEPHLFLYRASCSDFFGAVEDDSNSTSMLEALRLYVIPVPGNSHFYQLPQDTMEDEECAAMMKLQAEEQMPTHRKRRERPGEKLPDSTLEPDTKQPRQGEGREREVSQFGGAPQPAVIHLPLYQKLNLPHPPMNELLHTACIVTVIQHPAVKGERLQINDVVDFFGFLDDDMPGVTEFQNLGQIDEFEAFGAWHVDELPPMLLSRMTCMAWKHVFAPPSHSLLPSFYFENNRSLALSYLTNTICQGDHLLAEYILLHLCARVVTHESATPIGDVPLRVEGQTMNPKAWSSFMRCVAPVGEILIDDDALQLESPNFCITPRQDHTANVLRTGVLQLANGTHVTLDSGTISKAGNTFHDALFAVMHKQVLPLEYPYQVHELPIDLSFLALSTVKASEDCELLRFAVTVRWLPELTMAATDLTDGSANVIRDYFSHVRSVCRRFDKDNHSQTHCLAEKLVEFAKLEPSWNNHDPFIHNNSFSMAAALMRANASSFGREIISDEDVDHILLLERDRVMRYS